jgi:hypothetical protein
MVCKFRKSEMKIFELHSTNYIRFFLQSKPTGSKKYPIMKDYVERYKQMAHKFYGMITTIPSLLDLRRSKVNRFKYGIGIPLFHNEEVIESWS